MTRLLWGTLLLLLGCTGESHTTDRPLVEDCDTATSSGLQSDPCAFDVECGIASGDTLRSAVCDNGVLLAAVIEQEVSAGASPCGGELVAEASVNVTFAPSERGCVYVDVCSESGAATSIRAAHVCQVGISTPAEAVDPWADCPLAVQMGADGDPCAGDFACIADRAIGSAGILPILGWCDAGVLRLAPSQTLLFGPPGG